MKTYYINQKFVSLTDHYYIYNAYDEACLEITSSSLSTTIDRILGGIFSLGHTLFIKNPDGSEFATIKKRAGFLLEKYDVFYEGKEVASLKQLSMLKATMSMTTEKDNYDISGNFWARDFTISNHSAVAAKIKKASISLKDRYAVEIYEEGNDKLFLSAVIAIDNSFHN